MPWRTGLLAVLLTWLFLAGPAVAGLKSYTDSRGVIHITNVPPRPAAQPADPVTAAHQSDPLPAAPQPSLATLPEKAASAEPAVIQPASSPEVDLQPAVAATNKVCQELAGNQVVPPAQTMDKIIEATGQVAAAGQNRETARQSEKQAAYEAALSRFSQLPVTQPEPRKTRELVTAGGIRRYRDARGVWHISNCPPEEQAAGSALLASAPSRRSNEPSPAENHRGSAAGEAAPWPLRKVAWSPDAPPGPSLSALEAAARTGDPGATSSIRRYRDSHGVIHIENVTASPESLPAVTLQARTAPPKAGAPLRRPETLPVQSLEAQWALKPASWSGETLPLQRSRSPSSRKTRVVTQGGIQRWRDKHGVWHIKSVEYPWPEGLPVPSQLAGLIPGAPASGPPAALRAPPQAPPQATKPPLTTVMAFRDPQGRLQITNKPPPANVPPVLAKMAVPPAELAPLIAEAAQANRLPATLVRAVIKTESNFCSWAVSPKGAMGLMQLMPATAAFLGVQEPFNPRENLLGGCRYLRLLVDCFGGSLPLALAAYNAGFQRVIDCGYRIPDIKETQNFVTQVMGLYLTEEKRQGLPWT